MATANLVQIYVGGSEVSNIECNCPWSVVMYSIFVKLSQMDGVPGVGPKTALVTILCD